MRIRTDGSYYCYRCSEGSSWSKLKNLVSGNSNSDVPKNVTLHSIGDFVDDKKTNKSNKIPDQVQALSCTLALFERETNENQAIILKYLFEERCLTKEVYYTIHIHLLNDSCLLTAYSLTHDYSLTMTHSLIGINALWCWNECNPIPQRRQHVYRPIMHHISLVFRQQNHSIEVPSRPQ